MKIVVLFPVLDRDLVIFGREFQIIIENVPEVRQNVQLDGGTVRITLKISVAVGPVSDERAIGVLECFHSLVLMLPHDEWAL